MYSVYVIQSIKFGRYYIGYSSNFEKRIIEHNNGEVKSTKFYRPYKEVYRELFETKSQALIREKELKKMKKSKNFLNIIARVAQG